MIGDDLYNDLRYGSGSPGENARVLAKEYARLKSIGEHTSIQICNNLLSLRFQMYKSLGILIDSNLTQRILNIANGYFPFIIFADTFVVNKNNRVNNLDAIIGTLTIILNIIEEGYNDNVDVYDRMEDQEILISKVAEFLKEVTGIDLYAE